MTPAAMLPMVSETKSEGKPIGKKTFVRLESLTYENVSKPPDRRFLLASCPFARYSLL